MIEVIIGEDVAVRKFDGERGTAKPAFALGAIFAKDGSKPKATEGLSFMNTGVNLITDKPAEGVKSIDTKEGLAKCWG